LNIEIANRIAALRERNGLSQEQLADRLGVSSQEIAKWERAESSPDTDKLVALAKLYQVSLDELLNPDPQAEPGADGASGEGRATEPDEENGEERQGDAPGGGVWRFQRADGRMDLKVFPYPVLVTLVYLLIGFLLDLWHPGWMLFLTIPVYYTAISPNGGFDLNRVPFPLLVTILYLVAGFARNFWHPGWLMFLTIPLYYTLAGRVIQEKVNRVLVELMLVGVIYLIGASLGHWFQLWLVVPALAFIVLTTIRERRVT
jgi:transcriptional regulator with XRE-family HTH domain